jgi:hypothetical protein
MGRRRVAVGRRGPGGRRLELAADAPQSWAREIACEACAEVGRAARECCAACDLATLLGPAGPARDAAIEARR